jgi:hypothetical protein
MKLKPETVTRVAARALEQLVLQRLGAVAGKPGCDWPTVRALIQRHRS